MKKKSYAIYDDTLKTSSNLNRITKSNNIQKFTIGNTKSSIIISDHQFLKDEQKVLFKYKNKKFFFVTKLIGKVQIKNLLMAIMAAIRSRIPLENVLKIINKIRPVNGRLEKIGNLYNKLKKMSLR